MSATAHHGGSLTQLRQEIESIDRSLVMLLAARLDAAQRALRVRVPHDRRATDTVQERRVLLRSHKWAKELGLPEALVDSLFRTLIEEGKARFHSGRAPEGSPAFITVLLAGPDAYGTELGRAATSEVAPVAGSR